MVNAIAALLVLVVLVLTTVRAVQWLTKSGPYNRSFTVDGDVAEQRRALRDEIEDRQSRESPHDETADLNDAWMSGEAFGPPGARDDDPRR